MTAVPAGSSAARGRQANSPRQIPLRGWKDVLVRTVREFKDDQISTAAAAAAFYAWLALIPAAIGAITMYGLVASPDVIAGQIDELTASLSSDVKQVITDPITAATNASGKGLSIGLIISLGAVLWSASGGMNGMIQAVNTAYDEVDERNFLKKRGLAILMTLGAIVAFVVAILLVAVVPPVLDALQLGAFANGIVSIGRWVLLALLMMFGLSLLYRFAPDRSNARFRWISWGAVVATVLWLIASAGFSFYVNNFGSYNKTYGALAGVIVLNLWLYISCLAILFGAELNAELEAQTERDSTTGPAEPLGHRGARKADEVGPSTHGSLT
ncbi:YihY/virulence factor BrkB family protein [Cryptosporangium arvum]|jgi:membrane protein|uniref:YihY/virulence factor BrkB family protein n=1 Tax=Cryptosporangium arvum TaxID=80871 RepID=UPI00056B2328|nr:YihY/virulence factor BrkB family protein [Cryptosporangium arvum]